MRKPLTEDEVREELGTKTTEELLAFRGKLRKLNTPQSWFLRFFIVQELLRRTFWDE